MKILNENPNEKLKKYALRSAEGYSWDKIGDETEEVYRK